MENLNNKQEELEQRKLQILKDCDEAAAEMDKATDSEDIDNLERYYEFLLRQLEQVNRELDKFEESEMAQ